MAKFIIRRLTQFEGLKILELKSIKNRFKIIEKDNGPVLRRQAILVLQSIAAPSLIP